MKQAGSAHQFPLKRVKGADSRLSYSPPTQGTATATNPPPRHNLMASITFEHLDVLQTVARVGSFSGAANELQLSQSAVSQRIKHLERLIGTSLFDRARGKSIRLTLAGHRLLELAQVMIAELDRFRGDVEYLAQPAPGETVRIGAGSALIKYRVLPVLADFRKAHPEATVILIQVSPSNQIKDAVLNGDVDLGMYIGPSPERHLVGFGLRSDKLLLVAPSDHPILKASKDDLWKILQSAPFALTPKGAHIRLRVDRWAHTHGLNLNIVLESISLDTLKESVLRSLCLSILPEFSVADELQVGRLSAVAAPGFPQSRPLWLVADAKRMLSASARAFIAFYSSRDL